MFIVEMLQGLKCEHILYIAEVLMNVSCINN